MKRKVSVDIEVKDDNLCSSDCQFYEKIKSCGFYCFLMQDNPVELIYTSNKVFRTDLCRNSEVINSHGIFWQ